MTFQDITFKGEASMDTFKAAGAKAVKDIRVKLKLTQVEFAELFNGAEPAGLQTTQKDICRYETGVNGCPLEKLMKFKSLAKKRRR